MPKLLITPTTVAMIALGGLVAGLPACATTSNPRAQSNTQGPRLLKLYQQIQQLQQQVRQLNGQVDTLQHKLKQNQQGQQKLYQSLDKRLSKIENGGASATGDDQVLASGNQNSQSANVDSATKSAYMDGFNKLKNGQYGDAIPVFKQFVAQHPKSSLTDNAWYWLGEAYYVQQDLDESEHAFETVVNRFSNSSKIPASLYKIGLILIAKSQTDNAKSTLQRVVDQYPKSNSAGQARQKLKSLGSG